MEKITLSPDIELLKKHEFDISYRMLRCYDDCLPPEVQMNENLEMEVENTYYEKFQKALEKTRITNLDDTLLYTGLTQILFKKLYLRESDTLWEKQEKAEEDMLKLKGFFQRNGLYKGNESRYKNIQEIIIKTSSESFKISHPDHIYTLLNKFAQDIDKAPVREQDRLELAKNTVQERIRKIGEEIDLYKKEATPTQLEEHSNRVDSFDFLKEINQDLELLKEIYRSLESLEDNLNQCDEFFRPGEKKSTRSRRQYARSLFDLIRETHPSVPKNWIYHCIGLVFYVSGIRFEYYGEEINPFTPDFHPAELMNKVKRILYVTF